MLAQEDDDKNKKAVYYLSKRFDDHETRYTPIEKSCFAFVWGCAETETHHFTFSDINSSQNGPIEVSILKTFFEWKTIKMVDPISRI